MRRSLLETGARERLPLPAQDYRGSRHGDQSPIWGGVRGWRGLYLHSSDERQRMLAAAIGRAASAVLGKTATASGTEVARHRGQRS
jgi:hypothetical protein